MPVNVSYDFSGMNYHGGNLWEYIRDGEIEVVRKELKKGNFDPNDYNLADTAALNNRIDILKMLIEAGVNVHAKSEMALRSAARRGHLEIVKLLIEDCGADIHALDDGPLRWAAEIGQYETIKYLIEKGANIHARDDEAFKSICKCRCILNREDLQNYSKLMALFIELGVDTSLYKRQISYFKRNMKKEALERII